MKKTLTLIAFLFASTFAFAQVNVETTGNRAYNEGDKIFIAGISFGGYGYGFAGTRSIGIPPLTAALEFGIHENFSVGPYLGYASYRYDWAFAGGNYSYNFLNLGARGSFHYVPLLNDALDLGLDEEKLDFYISLLLGLEFQRYNADGVSVELANNTEFIFGPVLGFKYKFNDKFGVYFEGGRGAFGYGTLGIAVHF